MDIGKEAKLGRAFLLFLAARCIEGSHEDGLDLVPRCTIYTGISG